MHEGVGDGVLGLEHHPGTAGRLERARVGDRDLGRPPEDPQRRARARLLLGGVVDLLEDAGHGEDERRLERLEVREQVARVGGVAQHGTGRDAQHFDVAREDVGERHEQQRARVRLRADLTEAEGAVERERHEVAVREHDPLRAARRARRVDDRRDVVGAELPAATLDLGVRDVRAVGDQRRDAPLVDHDDLAKVAQLATSVLDDGRVSRRLDDRESNVGVREDPAHLVGRRGLVDRHADGACGPDREVGDGPLVARVRHDRHVVAGSDPVRDQPLGDCGHLSGEGGRGDGGPGPAETRRALDHGPVRAAGDALGEQRRDAPGLVGVDEAGGRDLAHRCSRSAGGRARRH